MNINNAQQQTEESSAQEAITWATPFFLSVALDVDFYQFKALCVPCLRRREYLFENHIFKYV